MPFAKLSANRRVNPRLQELWEISMAVRYFIWTGFSFCRDGKRGTVRKDAADGCIEKIDLEFIRWIIKDGRTKAKQLHYQKIWEQYRHKCVVFHNRKDVDRWLAGHL